MVTFSLSITWEIKLQIQLIQEHIQTRNNGRLTSVSELWICCFETKLAPMLWEGEKAKK